MNWISMKSIFVIALFAFPTMAELTSEELKIFEELTAHVKSLEWKLNNVELELKAQKEINQKQEKELDVFRIQIDSLKKNTEEPKQTVDENGNTNEIENMLMKQILNSEVKENITKSADGQIVRRHKTGQNKIRVSRQDRENIAFSAFLNHDLSNLGPGHTIQYGATVINEGNAFNVNTGVFTVPMDGVYLFSYACEDYRNHRIYADILVDGTRKSLVLEGPAPAHSMGTNVVILRLTKGQAVWVAIDSGGHDDILQNTATTFSGVFLYY